MRRHPKQPMRLHYDAEDLRQLAEARAAHLMRARMCARIIRRMMSDGTIRRDPERVAMYVERRRIWARRAEELRRWIRSA